MCGKSKWKFKMAFAMKGGGSGPVSSATYLFWKMIFIKNHLESFPDCQNKFCTSFEPDMVGGADAQAWNVFHKLWQLDTQFAEFVESSQAFIVLWRNIAKAVDLKGRHCGCNVCYEMCIFLHLSVFRWAMFTLTGTASPKMWNLVWLVSFSECVWLYNCTWNLSE